MLPSEPAAVISTDRVSSQAPSLGAEALNMDAARVSSLIGDIYDAALDPDLWVGTLEKTCAFCRRHRGNVASHDISQQTANFYFTWNDNPEYTKSYVERYAAINPAIVPAAIQTQVGDVSIFLDFITLEEYRKTQFYKEWSAPQGYIDAVQVTLDKSATSYAGVAVMRHDSHGPADDGVRQRMALLAPHFRRAVAISKVIDLHKVEAAALADTLDGLAAGLILVSSTGPGCPRQYKWSRDAGRRIGHPWQGWQAHGDGCAGRPRAAGHPP